MLRTKPPLQLSSCFIILRCFPVSLAFIKIHSLCPYPSLPIMLEFHSFTHLFVFWLLDFHRIISVCIWPGDEIVSDLLMSDKQFSIVLWSASPATLFTCVRVNVKEGLFNFHVFWTIIFFESYSFGTSKSSKATVKMVWRLPLSSKILHLNHCLTNEVNELEESNFINGS